MEQKRPRSITIIAWLMIVFGGAELPTGFTHDFLGLKTAQGTASAYLGAAIGALYFAAGLLGKDGPVTVFRANWIASLRSL